MGLPPLLAGKVPGGIMKRRHFLARLAGVPLAAAVFGKKAAEVSFESRLAEHRRSIEALVWGTGGSRENSGVTWNVTTDRRWG
jgi:hypothetical protein